MTWGDLDLTGCLQLSTFYLLSGFCLAVSYGPRSPGWSAALFYRARLARLAPLYYATNILAYVTLPPIDASYQTGLTTSRALLTLTMTNMWVSTEYTFAIPAWTITTMVFFYLAFPFLLPHLQSLSSPHLRSLVFLLFHLQFLPFLILLHIASCPDMTEIFCRHPITRFTLEINALHI